MDTFINSEDPNEMPHYAAFHQGLYCLLGKKDLQTKKKQNKKTTTFKNYNLTPQGMYSGLSKVYCIKPEGKIHLYTQLTVGGKKWPASHLLVTIEQIYLLKLSAAYKHIGI